MYTNFFQLLKLAQGWITSFEDSGLEYVISSWTMVIALGLLKRFLSVREPSVKFTYSSSREVDVLTWALRLSRTTLCSPIISPGSFATNYFP